MDSFKDCFQYFAILLLLFFMISLLHIPFMLAIVVLLIFSMQARGHTQFPGSHPVSLNRLYWSEPFAYYVVIWYINWTINYWAAISFATLLLFVVLCLDSSCDRAYWFALCCLSAFSFCPAILFDVYEND